MAQNYNIYVHVVGGMNGRNGRNGTDGISPNLPKTPNKIIKQAMGGMALGGGVLMAASIVNQTMEVIGYLSNEISGNPMVSMAYNNFKSQLNWATNPITAITSSTKQYIETRKANIKIEEDRLATGNSIINNYEGKVS